MSPAHILRLEAKDSSPPSKGWITAFRTTRRSTAPRVAEARRGCRRAKNVELIAVGGHRHRRIVRSHDELPNRLSLTKLQGDVLIHRRYVEGVLGSIDDDRANSIYKRDD